MTVSEYLKKSSLQLLINYSKVNIYADLLLMALIMPFSSIIYQKFTINELMSKNES